MAARADDPARPLWTRGSSTRRRRRRASVGRQRRRCRSPDYRIHVLATAEHACASATIQHSDGASARLRFATAAIVRAGYSFGAEQSCEGHHYRNPEEQQSAAAGPECQLMSCRTDRVVPSTASAAAQAINVIAPAPGETR